MIEVNLLPGGRKAGTGGFNVSSVLELVRRRRGGGGDAGIDPYQGFFAVAAAITLGYVGFMFTSLRSETEELGVQLEVAVQDSATNAGVIRQIEQLRAQGDSIEARVAVIQEIDRRRYVWAHLLDEVAAAVPDYTWLREVLSSGEGPQVRIVGRAGSIFAITNFMNRLEGSRFLRSVSAETIQEVASEANSNDLVFLFELSATYDQPDLDELETVPLFDEGTSEVQSVGAGN